MHAQSALVWSAVLIVSLFVDPALAVVERSSSSSGFGDDEFSGCE